MVRWCISAQAVNACYHLICYVHLKGIQLLLEISFLLGFLEFCKVIDWSIRTRNSEKNIRHGCCVVVEACTLVPITELVYLLDNAWVVVGSLFLSLYLICDTVAKLFKCAFEEQNFLRALLIILEAYVFVFFMNSSFRWNTSTCNWQLSMEKICYLALDFCQHTNILLLMLKHLLCHLGIILLLMI